MARYNPFDVFFRELAIKGTMGAGRQMARAVSLLATLQPERLFSHGYPLEQVRQAIEHRRSGEGLRD